MTMFHYPQPARCAPAIGRGARPGFQVFLACFGLVFLACLGACSAPVRDGGSRGSPGYGESTEFTARANEVLIRAIGLVGTPYRYGGNTPAGGFDCSGLVEFVFLDAAGLKLPRSTRELIELRAREVRRDRLQPGDLVFFNPGGGPVSHIGIYVGEGRFVHAPRTGGTVRLELLDTDYWERAYVGAKRVLR